MGIYVNQPLRYLQASADEAIKKNGYPQIT